MEFAHPELTMAASGETFDLTTEEPIKRRTKRFYCIVALGILAAIVIFFIGFIIGYFAVKARTSDSQTDSSDKGSGKGTNGEYKQYHEQLVNSLRAESVEEFSQ